MGVRENCPARSVETILKVITKRWRLQILFDMFCGKKTFQGIPRRQTKTTKQNIIQMPTRIRRIWINQKINKK